MGAADYRKMTIDLALWGKTRFHGDSIQTPTPATGSNGASVCACPDCPSRARVTFLERALLDRDDRIENLFSANPTLSIRLTVLREQLAGWKTILSNPKLKPADRIAAIPVIEDVRAAQRLGQDEVHVRYLGIVKGWGIAESTLGKSYLLTLAVRPAPRFFE